MLRAINDGVKQLASVKSNQIYHLGNANTIARNKRILQDKDIIEHDGDHFIFVDPIFKLWLTQETELNI